MRSKLLLENTTRARKVNKHSMKKEIYGKLKLRKSA